MIRFNKARLVGVRLVVLSFVLAGDPAAMVHDGKVYIYGGHDECPPPNEHYLINEWCVFSSPGLKT